MAPKVLAAVYSGFEDLRRGRVVAFISLVPCKLHSFIPMLHFTIFCYERQLLGTKWSLNGWRKQTNKQQHLYYNRSRWQAAGKSAWCNKKKKKRERKKILLLWSQHIAQNARKTAALASLNYLFSSLKGATGKLERQLVLHFEIQTASLGYQGEKEKSILRKQRSKQGR